VVTLKGNVDNETSRKTAIQLATGVEGVRGVNDQLKVGSS
jgi:osmotically-inducible protein OsmY